jgi:hypothetical protein
MSGGVIASGQDSSAAPQNDEALFDRRRMTHDAYARSGRKMKVRSHVPRCGWT